MQPIKHHDIIQTANLPSIEELIEKIDSSQRLRFSTVLLPNDDLYLKFRYRESNSKSLMEIFAQNFPSQMQAINLPSKKGISQQQFKAILLHHIGEERNINIYYSLNFNYHKGGGADPEIEYTGYNDGSGDGGLVRNLIATPSDFTKRFSWISFRSVRGGNNIDEAKQAIKLFCQKDYIPVSLSLWDPGENTYTFEDGELNNLEDYELVEGKIIKHVR